MNRPARLTLWWVCFSLFLMSCNNAEEAPATQDSPDLSQTQETIDLPPTLTIDPFTLTPDVEFVIDGVGFPPNEVILLYISDSDVNLGPAISQQTVDADGEFSATLTAPIIWPGANLEGKSKLIIVAEDLYQQNLASTNFVLNYADAFRQYVNESAGYSVYIPIDWEVSEAQRTPLGELVIMGTAPLDPGNPGTSKIISTSLDELSARDAAQLIKCGSTDCDDSIQFTITEINGLQANHVTVSNENTPEIEWYFLTYGERLIYFTLQDPRSLMPLTPLINSFSLLAYEPEQVLEAGTISEDSTESDGAEVITTDAEESSVENPSTGVTPEVIEIVAEETVSVPSADATETIQPTPISADVDNVETPTPEEESDEVEATAEVTTNESEATVTAGETITPPADRTAGFPTLPDPEGAGPMQTVINLLSILSRNTNSPEIYEYFAPEIRSEFEAIEDVLPYLTLPRSPISFDLFRLNTVPVRVQASVTVLGGSTHDIELVLEKVNDRWLVIGINSFGEEQVSTPTNETDEEAGLGPVTVGEEEDAELEEAEEE